MTSNNYPLYDELMNSIDETDIDIASLCLTISNLKIMLGHNSSPHYNEIAKLIVYYEIITNNIRSADINKLPYKVTTGNNHTLSADKMPPQLLLLLNEYIKKYSL